jgi:hypothetical protein
MAACTRHGPWDEPAVLAARQALADSNRDVENNSYLAGVGYYHAPFFAWYPHPFNFHDAIKGYYYGGGWHRDPFFNPSPRSHPSAAGIAAALAQLPTMPPGGSSSWFGGGSGGHYGWGSGYYGGGSGYYGGGDYAGGSWGGGSVSRGGFGSSGHGGAGE